MRFGERLGFCDSDFLQVNSINQRLRNRLWNAINNSLCQLSYDNKVAAIHDIIDNCGLEINDLESRNILELKTIITLSINDNQEWYLPYEIFEEYFSVLDFIISHEYDVESARYYSDIKKKLSKQLTTVLYEEKSGYRLLNNKFVPVTSEQELESISDALSTPYPSVNQHMKKALESFSNKEKPNYEGTIKDVISAVESMCSIIVGKDTTLSAALKQLEKNGVKIHPAMKEAFIKLYAYASDETGIRHGGIDFKNAPQEDAKFMLITCSAFINYLIEKYNV